MTPDITISPQSKNEILIGKSLLDLRKDKNNGSSSIQLEADPYIKVERESINIIYDSPEWGSQISSVPFFDQIDEETEYEFTHRKNHLMDESDKKHFPKHEKQDQIHRKTESSGSYNKNEAHKLGKPKTKNDDDEYNNIVTLKKYLLSKENPENKKKYNESKQSNFTITPKDSRKTSPIILSRKTSVEEAIKTKVYSYNPFIEIKSPQPKLHIDIMKNESESIKDSVAYSIKDNLSASNKLSESNKEEKTKLPKRGNRVSFHAKHLRSTSLNKSPFIPPPTEKEEEIPKNKYSLASYFNMLRIVKKLLRTRYLKNRKEVYKYDPKEDPPVRKVIKRNKELTKRRDRHEKQDKAFEEKSKNKIIEESEQDFFDFTGYYSFFTPKISVRVPANATHPGLGKIVKAGFVQKVTNKSKGNHQRWLILRSFYLYWYTSPSVYLPQGAIPLPTIPLKEMHLKSESTDCIVVEQSKGRELTIFYEEEWKAVLSNEMANKRYMELGWENKKKPSIGMIEYFEDENCKTINLSNEKLDDPILYNFIYDSFRYHPKLKELNLAKCQLNGELLKSLFKTLKTLKKSIKIESLNLDSNGITKEMLDDISDYLESEISFSLKKFYINFNPIGDNGVQTLLESMLTRFERINSEKKKIVMLPFTELGLSGTRMADQSVFTLTTVFQEINKKLGDRGFEDNKELMKLEMAFNMISDNGMNALSNSLTTFHGIRELNLSSNLRLTGVCFDILMTNLRKNVSLEKLDYRKNALNMKGLENLFENLTENFLLKKINVTMNHKLSEAFVERKDVIMDFYKIVFENQEQASK